MCSFGPQLAKGVPTASFMIFQGSYTGSVVLSGTGMGQPPTTSNQSAGFKCERKPSFMFHCSWLTMVSGKGQFCDSPVITTLVCGWLNCGLCHQVFVGFGCLTPVCHERKSRLKKSKRYGKKIGGREGIILCPPPPSNPQRSLSRFGIASHLGLGTVGDLLIFIGQVRMVLPLTLLPNDSPSTDSSPSSS